MAHLGAATAWGPHMLLHEVIEFGALKRPDDVALVSDDTTISFGALWGRIGDAARWLARNLTPGQRIAVVSDNRVEVVVLLYAAPMAGVSVMLANTRLVSSEIDTLIDDVDPSLIVGEARLLAGLESCTRVRSVAFEDTDLGVRDAARGAAGEVGEPLDTSTLSANDIAWIIHTSGTTGRPKGAELTHRSLLAGVSATALARPLNDGDTYLFPFPLFHVAAYNVIHAHLKGRPVVLVAKFDAGEVLHLIERHRVTTLSLAPTMISMLLDHPRLRDHDLSSLQHIFYGASAIPIDVLRRGIAAFGCGFGQGYGMTELSGNVAFLDAEAHARAIDGDEHLLSACGKPTPLAGVRIADPDPTGAGEILIRGDQVIARYWRRGDADAAAFVDGWFRTGDVGRFDDEGFLYIVDRVKDIIVSGGENVASLEVEDVLSEHPCIGSVAVVGVADERWGERVVAVVTPRGGSTVDPADVVAWAKGRLAGYKCPKQVYVADALPMNASGKVIKAQVRTMAAELANR